MKDPMTLKCDEADCDVEIPCPDYGPHYIGTPCPKCGANLLTQQDFDDAEPFRALFAALAEAGLTRDPSGGDDVVAIGFNQHNGKTTITVQKPTGAADCTRTSEDDQ